jgi:hypothetical protein
MGVDLPTVHTFPVPLITGDLYVYSPSGVVYEYTLETLTWAVNGANLRGPQGLPGGLPSVADVAARNAIPSGDRYQGYMVFVQSESTNYQLVGGIANSNWKQLSTGGGATQIEFVSPVGLGAVYGEEYGLKHYAFIYGNTEYVEGTVLVPSSYVPGSRPYLKIAGYNNDVSNKYAWSAQAYLIQPLDDLTTTLKANSATSSDVGGTYASVDFVEVPLSDAAGQLTGFAIAPGDFLRIRLSRTAPTVAPSSQEIRLLYQLCSVRWS